MTQRVSHQRVDAMLFEACVDSVDSAKRAVAGGARRLELCAALIEGGLTPSIGLVRGVANAVAVPLHVLIRPRPGDFLYSDDETIVMLADIEACKAAGAAGVVVRARSKAACTSPGGQHNRLHAVLRFVCSWARCLPTAPWTSSARRASSPPRSRLPSLSTAPST